MLNALKELHLILAQGAHNQFGDLPWTARVEMLIQKWLLARPEIREFLGGAPMVPYKESWMAHVDSMKTLQGWTDVTVSHFRDLGVFGEQILLSVRHADWNSDDVTQANAYNWAIYWRPEIQSYIHSYRAVTGVDLSSELTDSRSAAARYVQPAIHQMRRLNQQRGFSYTARAEGVWQLLLEKTLSAFKALVQLFGQTSKLEQGFPTETSSESIAWYLFSINPFLDYAFTLPGKQSVLMLDWAEDEAVLFPLVRNGERSGYNPLSPGDAKGTPVAHNSLTGLQRKLVADFVSGPSRAKVIGVHAPPISPQSDWSDIDVFRSKKTYADPEKARGPKGRHPLFTVPPSRHVTTPYGMVADRGSWGKEKERDWFIRMLGDSKYSVRMVLAGHVHRNGVYIVHGSSKPIDIVNPKDPSRKQRLVNPLIVGGLHPQICWRSPSVCDC